MEGKSQHGPGNRPDMMVMIKKHDLMKCVTVIDPFVILVSCFKIRLYLS